MATQYEVEHGIKPAPKARHGRRIDMSTFNARLREAADDPSAPALSSPSEAPQTSLPRSNPHANPTPVAMASLIQLLQDQFATLASDTPDNNNREFLMGLFENLEDDLVSPSRKVAGVSQEFLDTLERVSKKQLHSMDGSCPICAERYLDDPYPLVVQLKCHKSHHFDLECVGPWLQLKGSCPLCRADMTESDPRRKRELAAKARSRYEEAEQEGDEEDPDMLYG